MDKKYRLIRNSGLYQIEAVRNFGDVKKGDVGGFIEKESNLSHDGMCWVYNNARVTGDAKVSQCAKVRNNAFVFGSAAVCENSIVEENALVYDYATIAGRAIVGGSSRVFGSSCVYYSAQVRDNAMVYDSAIVGGFAHISDEAKVFGGCMVVDYADVCGKSKISEFAKIFNFAKITDYADVFGNANVFGHATVCGNSSVYDNAQVSGNSFVTESSVVCTNTIVCGDAYLDHFVDYQHDLCLKYGFVSDGKLFNIVKATTNTVPINGKYIFYLKVKDISCGKYQLLGVSGKSYNDGDLIYKEDLPDEKDLLVSHISAYDVEKRCSPLGKIRFAEFGEVDLVAVEVDERDIVCCVGNEVSVKCLKIITMVKTQS